MFYDYHVHTNYSDDSTYLMEDVVKDAIAMGMEEICFTDHVDYGVKLDVCDVEEDYNGVINVDYPAYFKELEELKEKYKEKIAIKKGLEFGIQTHTIPLFQKLYDAYDYDFVILSCHQVNDLEFWTGDFQKGKTQQTYIDQYYNEILSVIKEYKDYSVLGHLDMINRYDAYGPIAFEKIKPIISEILKVVIKEGKGIEINTSSHRYGLKDTTPSVDILKLYKELGGKIITIGSDSHQKEHLGAYIKETQELLKQLGFQYYCTYEKMKPFFHKL